MARPTPGIVERHARSCPTRAGGKCGKPCVPSFEAWVWSRQEQKKIRRSFPTIAAAKSWRADATRPAREGTLRSPSKITLRQEVVEWLEGARAGTISKRGGETYSPAALRGYETALRRRVLPDLGAKRISEVQRLDLQDLVDRLKAAGVGASTIRNTIVPLQAIFRRALARNRITVNPALGLELPAITGRRERIADPAEAARLLDALPEADRPIWATAMYAGLRRGELLALRWNDIDLTAGVIRVERSWDLRTGPVRPKSRAGTRVVPIPQVLRGHLAAHRLRSTADGDALVFGRSPSTPFDPMAVSDRAACAWAAAVVGAFFAGRALEVAPITLHECRHTFASLMIAAGVNAKAISTYMGHASVSITLDRYGHLMPGNESQAAALLDAYLATAETDEARPATTTN
jgi:integrase